MEAAFLFNSGSLAEKLMAALQGANVPGADSRCTAEGVSSLSAFIRVAWPSDTNGTFYLDLNVPSTPYGVEPIDSLQVLFDEWLGIHVGVKDRSFADDYIIYPNPASDMLIIHSLQLNGAKSAPGASAVSGQQSRNVFDNAEKYTLTIFNSIGHRIEEYSSSRKDLYNFKINLQDYTPGIYTLTIKGRNAFTMKKFLVIK
jgi:hypothetical protein